MVRVIAKRKQSLPDWIEASVVLPEGTTVKPGPMRLFSYQRGICEAIGDPAIERASVLKSARIGYSAVMTAALARFVVDAAGPILVFGP